jgi:hypothetical protein
MNDYKDKYSVSSDNTLREKQYEIKKHISISANDINTFCSAKGVPVEWLMYELLSKYSINELKQRI